MRCSAVIIAMLIIIPQIARSQRYSIAGYVADMETKETLIGANILIQGTKRGSSTDINGYFRITGLAPGTYRLKILYIGYEEKEIKIDLYEKSIVLNDILLKPKPIELNSIVVKAERSEVADYEIETSPREITPMAIRRIPTSRGDVFKALEYLPGIETIDPLSPLYSVRGGDPGENLILLDGVTIYNPYHCVSSSSLFNLYAIKNVEILIGGFGVEYGGRNSSVLYISTREGNSKELHGEIEPGSSSSKMVFDFPLSKNATMMVSARAYYDLISKFLLYSPAYLYDANISINWKLNKKNRISLRYFYSHDFMDMNFSKFYSYLATTFEEDIFDNYELLYQNIWNNQAVTFILKSIVSPRVYLKTQISGSFFSSNNISKLDFEYTDPEDNKKYKLYYRTAIKNRIQDITSKITLNVQLNKTNSLLIGSEFSSFNFSNGVAISYIDEGRTTRKPNLIAAFIEDKIRLGGVILRGGVRLSKFGNIKKLYFEPRFNLLIYLPYDFKLRAAWGNYYQFITSINSQEYELSQYLDYYYPLINRKPCSSVHHIIGLDKSINNSMLLSVDFYYKDIRRVYTFDYNLSETEVYTFSDKIRSGTGKSFGFEVVWKGTWKKFAGWISYGFGRSTRTYPHIMNGESFLFDYDRTHAFKLMINHQIHPLVSYSATLRILSGVPKTIESMVKSYYYYNPISNEISSFPIYVTEKKNNARLPLFIRLDIGLKKRLTTGFGAQLARFLGADHSYLNLTFGNLLFFHRNVLFYFPVGKKRLYGFGTNYLPEVSMGYTVKF